MSRRRWWSRGHPVAARLLFVLGGLTGCASATAGRPAEEGGPDGAAVPASVASTLPYYTAEQATRGQRVFTTVCSVCHGRNEFTGPIFSLTWMADPVGNLFEHISTNMPQDRPGSLSGGEYAAVVAYLLELNGRPAGERELPADAQILSRMRW